MILRRGVLLVPAAAFGVGCMVWVEKCTAFATCAGAPAEQWGPLLLAAAIPTAGILLGLCCARAGYILLRAHGRLAMFETVAPTAKLRMVMESAEVNDVRCLDAVQPLAFCSGVLRPKIFISTGLQLVLSGPELEAVLRHEEHHRLCRHPLLRALLVGSADVMFFLPVVGWLAERVLEDAELAADRAAIRRLGHKTVAAALWRVGSPAISAPRHAIGFDGAAELRAAQLLGESLRARRPAMSQCLQSLLGIVIALELSLCAYSAVVSVMP